ILLDLVRVAALRPCPSLVIVDEFSALGREGRPCDTAPGAKSRVRHGMCAGHARPRRLAPVDRDLPQQIAQNTAVRLALRQGSAEDQAAWSALLGGAPIPFSGSDYVRSDRAAAVARDELAMLRTGEAFLHVMPGD